MKCHRTARVAIAILILSPAAVQAESRFFDSDGTRIHFVDKGEGEPVVLIHGFAASGRLNWELPGILDGLARTHRVLAMDNRGHGKSDKPHDVDQYGVRMVADVVRLLDHVELEKAHVVGYSMGGFITTKLVTSHPQRVASAVIGAAGWRRDAEPRMALLDEIGDSLESGQGLRPLMLALNPTDRPAPSEAALQATNQMIMAVNDPLALAAAIRGMRAMTVEQELLENNRVPVTAVVGSIDPLREGVDELAAVMNHLELVLIDQADHMTAIRRPELLRSIRRHLKTHAIHPAPADVRQ